MAEQQKSNFHFTEDSSLLETLCDFVQSLGGTIVNIKRYPAGSAIINMALERSTVSVQKVFEATDLFTLSETEKNFLVNDEMLGEKYQSRAYIRTFIDSIIARNIRSLTFRRGLTVDEIFSFLNIMGEKPEDLRKKGDIAEQLKKDGITHIAVDEKVFVALSKGQAIADKADLERLAQMGPEQLSADQIKDGMFISYLISKLPIQNLNITDEQLEKMKSEINFDQLREAKDIDFDKLGPLIARLLENLIDADQQLQDLPAAGAKKSRAGQVALAVDERSVQIVQTFAEMSHSILNFKQPEIRVKLMGDFMKVVTNFKELTLAKILTANLGETEDLDLKGQIISQISTKKKSHIIDFLLQKYQRLIDGLNAEDFELNLDELQQSEVILKKIMQLTRAQERHELAEKAQKALGMVRAIVKEGGSPQSLLILKVKRLFSKGPEAFLDDEFLDNFGELAKRLIELKRPDIIRKTMERIGANFSAEDPSARLATINSFVRIHQELVNLARTDLLSEGYVILTRQIKQEPDNQVFVRILATLVSDFGRLIGLKDLNLASNLLNSLIRQNEENQNPAQKQLAGQAIQKLTTDAGTMSQLIEILKSENEIESDLAARLLALFERKLVLGSVFALLKDSEEMRIRKKCISLTDRYGADALESLIDALSASNPWYFTRNILNLLAGVMTDATVPHTIAFLADADERVRKAAIAAITKVSGPASEQALIDAFDSQPESIKKSIVQYFTQLKSKGAVPKLLSVLESMNITEETEAFAAMIIQALGQIGDQSAAGIIGGFLKKGGLFGLFAKQSEVVVQAALSALGQIGDRSSLGLVKKYASHANPQVAKAAQESISLLEAG